MSGEILQRTFPMNRVPVPVLDGSLRIGHICDVLVVLVLVTACVGRFSVGYFWAID